ncbi:hypothetical protein AGMMS50225_25990 [Betaproteobacteria bacterium]|nr:hypothetical protein AGMMS50225_25990 [Betaproteobacteria bacterium]
MNLISRLISLFTPAPPLTPDALAGLQRIGELVSSTLVMEPDFDAKLAQPVAHARAYCHDMIDALPPAIQIDRASFSTDPLVHALFATADDIGAMVAASKSVREYLAEPDSWQEDSFFALMAARRMEKKVLGVALEGNMLTSGVPQSLLQFSNQMLVFPAHDPVAARAALFNAGYDSLLRTFAQHVYQVHEEYKSLKTEREMERARLLSLPPHQREAFPPRRIAELDERLHKQFASIQPGSLVQALADFLAKPDLALHLASVRLWITRSGVVYNEAGHPDTEAINFTELYSRDRRHHVVLPVRIRTQEAREALTRAQEERVAHENILLI